MTKKKSRRSRLRLRPFEKRVPRIDIDAIFMDTWAVVRQEMGTGDLAHGYKYSDEDFIRAIVYKALSGKPMAVAVDGLNDLLYAESGEEPRCIDPVHERHARKVPNASQVNAFLRKLPAPFLARLEAAMFEALISKALEAGLITKVIEVYIDFHKLDYYGKDRNATNGWITNVHDGAGTSRARKYCELMISSGRGVLFADACLSRQGAAKEAWIFQALLRLQKLGFTIKRVLADREFSTYDVIAVMGYLDIPYTGPVRRTSSITRQLDRYIDGKCNAVIPFNLYPSTKARSASGPIPVHLIFKAEPGKRMRDIRASLASGKATRADTRKHMHTFITTEARPRHDAGLMQWGMRLANLFPRRWRIETGFRVSDGFGPSSHARSNKIKTFWLVMDRVNYDLWKVQQAPHARLKDVPKSWRAGQTRDRFSEVATSLLAQSYPGIAAATT